MLRPRPCLCYFFRLFGPGVFVLGTKGAPSRSVKKPAQLSGVGFRLEGVFALELVRLSFGRRVCSAERMLLSWCAYRLAGLCVCAQSRAVVLVMTRHSCLDRPLGQQASGNKTGARAGGWGAGVETASGTLVRCVDATNGHRFFESRSLVVQAFLPTGMRICECKSEDLGFNATFRDTKRNPH